MLTEERRSKAASFLLLSVCAMVADLTGGVIDDILVKDIKTLG